MKKRVSLGAVFQVTKAEYLHMVFDARNIVVLSMYLVFYDMILKKFVDMGVRMGKPINLVEPFLAICSADAVMIMFPLVFLVIISDYPRTEENFRFFLVRVGKVNWILGQILYAFCASITYVVATLVVTCVMAIPYSFVGNRWSEVVTRFYLVFPEEKNSMINELINGRLYNQTTPLKAVVHTCMLYGLFLFLLAIVCFVAYMFQKRVVGTCICGIMILIGCAQAAWDTKGMWFFPTTHAIVWKHYAVVLRQMVYPISWSYLYFLFVILFCIGIIFVRIKHRNLDGI